MTLSGWTKSITDLFLDQHLPVKERLVLHSHRPKDLVKLVRKQLNQPRRSWSVRKQQAWGDLYRLRRTFDWSKGVPSAVDLVELKRLLDDLLFDSSLAAVSIVWEWYSHASKPDSDSVCYGQTSRDLDTGQVTILMHPEPHDFLG